ALSGDRLAARHQSRQLLRRIVVAGGAGVERLRGERVLAGLAAAHEDLVARRRWNQDLVRLNQLVLQIAVLREDVERVPLQLEVVVDVRADVADAPELQLTRLDVDGGLEEPVDG